MKKKKKKKKKKIRVFLSENVQFLEMKFSIYLTRHVFVMENVFPFFLSFFFFFFFFFLFRVCAEVLVNRFEG